MRMSLAEGVSMTTCYLGSTCVHFDARKKLGEACGFARKVHPAVAGQNSMRMQGKDVGVLGIKLCSLD